MGLGMGGDRARGHGLGGSVGDRGLGMGGNRARGHD